MAHLHPVYDTDPHFSIDSTTRGITYESKEKLVIVQGDHNSQRYTFELPRYIDGHDMMLCDLVQVHYINIESGGRGRGTGVYKVTDMQLATDDQNTVVLSWLVSQNATKYVGSLNFVLRFACTSGSKIDYAWSTTVYSAVAIITSIDNADLVVEQYADVLEQWYMDLTMAGVSSVDTIYAARDAAVEKAKTDINTAKAAAIQAVQETDPDDDFVKKVADKIPVYGEDGEILGYDNDAPITAGTGKNSLVGNDTQNNAAISENVTSFGTGNIGGLKGYYWSNIDLSAKTIALATSHNGFPEPCKYAVGDVISIVNGAKYNNCSRITAISLNIVTVDSFPFTKIESETPAFDNYCIYCNAKPAIGTADLGKNAVVFGDNNKSGNRSSFIAGRDNAGVGQYGFAAGRGNTVAYASFAAGRNNNISHDYSCGIGWNNTSGGQVSTLIGYGNTGRGSYNFLIGASNDTSNNVTEQISIGFANHSEAKTTFSIGKNNKHYLPNGITIGTNNIGQGGVCLGDNNIVGGNQYTVGKNNRENFGAANVYRFGESLQPNSNQTIVGRYNKQVSSTTSFIVGVGTSNTDRKNGMWVTSDGNLSVGGSKLTLNANGVSVSLTAAQLTKLLALIE